MAATRVIGYVRIGPREKSASRSDLHAQREIIERECARRGWDLTRVDEDIRSGRTLQRPRLTAALASCRAGDADGIVVARLDRLTYSLDHLAQLVREALERGFNLVAPDLGVDLSTPEGRHLATVLATAARWTPRSLGRRAGRAIAGQRGTRGRGRPVSTPPELAGRIRSLRRQGWTLQAICDALNSEGVPTPRGGAEWRPTSLRAVLRPLSETSAATRERRSEP
jgi:DNA invertase Pin-like site-specific DNA recombinase